MTTLDKPKRVYTDEEIEAGLLALVFHRSGALASKSTGVPERTLYSWKVRHADRYRRIEDSRGERLAQIHDSVTLRLAAETHSTLDVYALRRHELKAKEAASAIRDLSVAQGVHEDKALLHRGKPTQVVEHTMDGLLRKLGAVGLVSSDEAIEDAVVIDDTPSLPSADQLHAEKRSTKAREDSTEHSTSSGT